MNGLDFGHYAFSIGVAAALLAGCGAPQAPVVAPGAIPESRAIAKHANRDGAWMLPEAKNEDLLYIATGDNVYVASYPDGKPMGALFVVGYGLCSDKDGDVFIATSDYEILEYAHGGTWPIQKLHAGDIPVGCAVDPTTGNLAVTQEGSGAGEVAIFPNAHEPSTWYFDPNIYTYGLCGYDGGGNLFVDGNGTGNYLAELPKGSSTFINYSLSFGYDAFGGIQLDGKHITLSNPTKHEVYRLKFGRSSFKVTGTTRITGWNNGYSGQLPYIQTWLQGSTFIAQSSSLAELGLWRYPEGGKAQKVLGPFGSGNASVYGVTVSLAPSR